MINIAIIWVAFFLIFLFLGIYYLIQSRKMYPHFKMQIKEKPMNSFYNAIAEANEKRIEMFMNEFNVYISEFNITSKKANRAACFGYFASSIVCIVSLLIELQIIK